MTNVDTAVLPPVPTGEPEERPRRLVARLGAGDRALREVARGSGIIVLAVMALVGTFLSVRAAQALHADGWKFFTSHNWQPDNKNFGIVGIISGTALIGVTAIVIAFPLAFGVALYISEYAPNRIRRLLISGVDLMAAVPSVVYGLWGFLFLESREAFVARWISRYFSWIPFFKVDGFDPHNPLSSMTRFSASTFIAGTVVALMITPITCSIMREAFSQAPLGEREGAYALGATKWGMIRAVVLPFGRGGMIGGTMLGLGRALGETIAVFMIISLIFAVQPHVLQVGASSVSSLIALRYGSADALAMSALMAAGLALFLITLVINFIAASIIARSRSGAESEV